jgi:hypothetical protein
MEREPRPQGRKVWPFVLAVMLLAALFLQRSQRPQVLSRYSYAYFLFLLACGVLIAACWLLYRRGYWESLLRRLRKVDPSSLSLFGSTHHVSLLLAVYLLHVVLLVAYVTPVGGILSEPILREDYANHFHQVSVVVEAMATEGKAWAYDPSFCAGYLVGTLFDVDMKLFELLSFGISRLGIGLPLAFNGLILLCFLSVPVILHLSSRYLGFSRNGILLAVLTGVLLWHSQNMLVAFNSYGMCTFVLGVYLSILSVSLLYRFLSQGKWPVYLFFLVTLALCPMAHITAPVILIVPALVLYIMYFRRISVREHVLLVLAVGVALAANSWWLMTLLRFLPYRVETGFWAAPGILELIRSILRFGVPELILGLLGIWGFLLLHRRNRPIAITGLAFIIYTFFLANMVASIPLLRGLEPGRFMIPFAVVSMIGLVAGVVNLEIKSHPGWMNLRTGFPILLLLLFFAGTIMAPRSLFDEGFHDYKRSLAPLMEWLRENTDSTARIAFQDASPGFLTGAKARYFLDREFIGGPFSQLNMKHGHASFTRFRFIDKRLDELTLEDLSTYADRYNIRWIVTSTDEARAVFGALSPLVEQVETLRIRPGGRRQAGEGGTQFERYKRTAGEYTVCVFEIDRPPDFFEAGDGGVSASLNRIEVAGATAGPVIIKYHWLETLVTEPPLPLREHRIGDMPVGFIEVENGETADFVIYNGY